MKKSFVLCADDFGMNSAISLGILELVHARRLSAVSCMVNLPDFDKFAPELLSLKDQVQIGLHINLTEGTWLSNPKIPGFSLSSLLIKSHIKRIDPVLIAQEITAQLERFIQIMGFYPDFIDGHQHVHQLPIIRDLVCSLYLSRLNNQAAYIRSTFPAFSPSKYRMKTKIILWTGGKKLHGLLRQLGIPHNSAFAGIYDFAKESNYRSLFRQWLSMIPESSLIMCHPGKEPTDNDVIGHARPKELAYFLSDDFIKDCQKFGKKLV